MEAKTRTDKIESSQMDKVDHEPVVITLSDKNIVEKVDHQNGSKKKRHSCFEWAQLIATICIPVIITIYTVVENNNKGFIAESSHRKDVEIANISRVSELEIAQANRLNELEIAEQSRQKDRDLATDQQHENILAQYQSSLANLLIDNDITLSSKSSMTKTVVYFMTRTALNQLDLKRKSFLVQSLYDAKLITLPKNSTERGVPTLEFRQIDLSNIVLGSSHHSSDKYPLHRYVDWTRLALPFANLVNTSFRHTTLDCVTFTRAHMNSADLSFVNDRDPLCFDDRSRFSHSSFYQASLINASLYNAIFYITDFSLADLTNANMRYFYCRECHFASAKLVQVNLSFSRFLHSFILSSKRLEFFAVNLKQATIHSSFFNTINFDKSDWSGVQASQIIIWNSTFDGATMEYCSFVQSHITTSVFENANLSRIDFSNATLQNVSFINTDMRNANFSYIRCTYCDFTNATFDGVILKNASLRYSIFVGCTIHDSQLAEAIDLTGSILPNGTGVKTND